jgi:hypothetical protein
MRVRGWPTCLCAMNPWPVAGMSWSENGVPRPTGPGASKNWWKVHYPEAERLVLVLDNLNTHTPAALYEGFSPEEARELAERLEIHYTPKHGSWLDMAEIELSVLARQCLDRRIPDPLTLTQEVAAWEEGRNNHGRAVDWRFTTADARIKLKHLYPSIQE